MYIIVKFVASAVIINLKLGHSVISFKILMLKEYFLCDDFTVRWKFSSVQWDEIPEGKIKKN